MINKFSDFSVDEKLKVKKFRKQAEKKSDVTGGGYEAVRDLVAGKSVNVEQYDDEIDITNNITESDKKNLYKKLKNIIPKIASSLGIEDGKIKFVGGGSFGIAFYVDDRVIKITSDEWEAKTAQYLINLNYSNLIKYYKVVQIENTGVYAILMDKVTPLNKKEREVVKSIIGEYGAEISTFLSNYENVDKEELTRLGYDKEYINILNQLFVIFSQLYEIDIMDEYADVHDFNLGWKGKTLVHYDIRGISDAPDVDEII